MRMKCDPLAVWRPGRRKILAESGDNHRRLRHAIPMFIDRNDGVIPIQSPIRLPGSPKRVADALSVRTPHWKLTASDDFLLLTAIGWHQHDRIVINVPRPIKIAPDNRWRVTVFARSVHEFPQ